jgi:hypothetical protein
LTVFVVNVESLKATALIHGGKFSKLFNQTTTTSTTQGTPISSTTSGDKLQEVLDEVPDDDVR